jgi:hypothetical protein
MCRPCRSGFRVFSNEKNCVELSRVYNTSVLHTLDPLRQKGSERDRGGDMSVGIAIVSEARTDLRIAHEDFLSMSGKPDAAPSARLEQANTINNGKPVANG